MSFICHIHNYTEYNQQWNVFSAFNPSKCTHTWSSGQPTMRRPGSSWGFGALLKGLTSVVDNSSRSRDSNPQPQVTSPTLYPLGHDCPPKHTYRIVGCHRQQRIQPNEGITVDRMLCKHWIWTICFLGRQHFPLVLLIFLNTWSLLPPNGWNRKYNSSLFFLLLHIG